MIGSRAYRNSHHPQSMVTRNTVTNWFASRYGAGDQIERHAAPVYPGGGQETRQNHIVSRVSSGKTLLVGEGNFSFTASLVFDHHVNPVLITSTIPDIKRNLPKDAETNVQKLSSVGVTVLDGVDATRLDRKFPHQLFDTIIFQFPNAGSREPNRGHNPNFILVRRFPKSSIRNVRQNGEIIISVVNSSYYDGRFRIEEAAEFAGTRDFFAIPFLPQDYPSYSHTNTNDEDSSLRKHRSFETWIFRS